MILRSIVWTQKVTKSGIEILTCWALYRVICRGFHISEHFQWSADNYLLRNKELMKNVFSLSIAFLPLKDNSLITIFNQLPKKQKDFPFIILFQRMCQNKFMNVWFINYWIYDRLFKLTWAEGLNELIWSKVGWYNHQCCLTP